MRRQLQGVRLWAATILVNRSIMTLYLWHMTVLVLVIGLLYALGGIGLAHTPGSSLWWSMRPLWLVGLATILLIVTALLFPLEQKTRKGEASPLPPWRAAPWPHSTSSWMRHR